MAFLAARQYSIGAARKQQSQREVHFSRYAVLAGGTVLASTSGYLLYLLGTVFQGETCVWCLTSAALSFGVFFSALRGFTMRYCAQCAVLHGDPFFASACLLVAVCCGHAPTSTPRCLMLWEDCSLICFKAPSGHNWNAKEGALRLSSQSEDGTFLYHTKGCMWTSLKCQDYLQASLRLGCSHSREIAEAAAPGSGIVASTILALGLAWSNVEAPEAQASFELPYVVRRWNVDVFHR